MLSVYLAYAVTKKHVENNKNKVNGNKDKKKENLVTA